MPVSSSLLPDIIISKTLITLIALLGFTFGGLFYLKYCV